MTGEGERMPAVMRGIVNRIRMREARTKHEEGAEEQRQEGRCSDASARIDRICSVLSVLEALCGMCCRWRMISCCFSC